MLKFCFNALVEGTVMYVGWFVGTALYSICF